MTTLRPYQRLALRHVQQRLQDGYHRLYVCLPTGTGKSVLMAALAHLAVEKGRVDLLRFWRGSNREVEPVEIHQKR